MHNQDENRQSLNDAADPEAFQEPSWVKPVKVAVVVMGVMIVICLGLLGYGLSTNVGKLAASGGEGPRSFAYPAGMTLTNASPGPDGSMMLWFKGDGREELVTINPASKAVVSRVQLVPSEGYGFVDKP